MAVALLHFAAKAILQAAGLLDLILVPVDGQGTTSYPIPALVSAFSRAALGPTLPVTGLRLKPPQHAEPLPGDLCETTRAQASSLPGRYVRAGHAKKELVRTAIPYDGRRQV
jgi:hypothetical protein